MLYFLYQVNYCLDEMKDIFKPFILDKSSFVQKKSCPSLLLLLSSKSKKNLMQSQHHRELVEKKLQALIKFYLNLEAK